MIKELKLMNSGDVIASYEFNGEKKELTYSSLQAYWEYATAEEIEGMRVDVINNDLVGIFVVASGQGGVLVVWNAEDGSIKHISEGAFTEAVDIFNSYVYSLRHICHWGTSPYVELYKIELGTKEIDAEGEKVDCDLPAEIVDLINPNWNVNLMVDENNIVIKIDDKEFVI